MKLSRLASFLYGAVLIASGTVVLAFDLADPSSISLTTGSVYALGIVEIALGISIMVGLARKVVYIAGSLVTLLVWVMIQALGGPAGPGYTDPGSGIVAALGLLLLLSLNKAHGTDPYTVDARIERHYGRWSRIAEMSDRQAVSWTFASTTSSTSAASAGTGQAESAEKE
jgi:uncharacterized membrane protein YphA (DoxX/SURF4 family)